MNVEDLCCNIIYNIKLKKVLMAEREDHIEEGVHQGGWVERTAFVAHEIDMTVNSDIIRTGYGVKTVGFDSLQTRLDWERIVQRDDNQPMGG